MHSRTVQIWVGLFVIAGLAALLMLSMKVSNISTFTETEGYEVTAHFENIGGLKVRSPVTMAGVVVGRVANIGFDKESYEAVVTLNIQNEYDNIPADTSASIFTAGLLGEQYIGLEAGGAEEVLTAGSELELTQSAIVLEQIIGQFLVSQADKE
ncbi:MAG TPA: outer membrane lipid asymmetry maintenance protein MlaD [Gammaproteobacteria bacterium]|nr:outer membrane lipid asymmetry maintenance protein MlaD [Gammaproteobacteria bacterium]